MSEGSSEELPGLPTIALRTRRVVTSVILLVGVALATAGAGLIASYIKERHAAAPRLEHEPIGVRTLVVERTDRPLRAEATGFLRPSATLDLAAEVSGLIVEKRKEEGERVEANEVVARVDDRSYRHSLEAARARRAVTKARLDYARKMRHRAERLVREDSIGESELDDWDSQTRALTATLAEHDAAIAEAALRLERSSVVAPRAGVWYEDVALPGEYVQPGTAIGRLRVLSPLELHVEVSAQVRLALSMGDSVEVDLLDVDPSLHAVPSTVAGARVQDLPAGVEERSGRFPVVIEVPNEGRELLPGLFAQVVFELPRAERLLLIPKECVFEVFGRSAVYVVGPSGADGVRRVEVRTVRLRELEDVPESWQVVEGLAAGERVVVSPIEQLSRGALVRVDGELDARTD